MTDRIEVRDLQVLAICGVLPEEQARRQPFAVDLDLEVDLATASRTDDLADTVDYAAVLDAVTSVAAAERFALLERFAGRLAEVALADERVCSVTVAVRKLRPPVPHPVATTGVRLSRRR